MTRRERPLRRHFQILRINLQFLAFVLDVHVDVSSAIRHRKFRLARYRDRSQHVASSGVYRGGIVALAVHGEDALRCRVVNNGVGIHPCFRAPDYLQGLQIENGDGVRAAIRGEASVELRREGDAVHTIGIRDFARHGSGVHVEDHHFRAARNEQATRR